VLAAAEIELQGEQVGFRVALAKRAPRRRSMPKMLVWVASFPRSGNTFLRIALHRLYGIRTSVVYDIDGVAQRLGPRTVGFEARPASIAEMRTSDLQHFVKTHRRRDDDVRDGDRVICLVRDGRDALVSWARQRCEEPGRDFRAELERMLVLDKPRGTGSWGDTTLSWLQPPMPHRAVLRYEHLVSDPQGAVRGVLSELDLRQALVAGASVPSFAQLRLLDPSFFRRGMVGSYRDEMPDDLHRLFWSRRDNAMAMALLGYAP
jgi:hypothetical protein